MAAADHGKRFCRGKQGGPRGHGHRLFAGIDQVCIHLFIKWKRPHAQQSVLGLQHDLHAIRDVIGRQGRYTNSQVDVITIVKFLRNALGQLLASQSHNVSPQALRTVRCSMVF